MMQVERFNKVRLGIASLMNIRELWVDTDWAVKTLTGLGIKNVAKIPWGLPFPIPYPIPVTNLDDGSWLLVPRLGNENFQPQIVVEVLQSITKKSPWSKIITIGMPGGLAQSLKSRDGVEFKHLPVLQENELLSLMAKVGAVFMAPQTDGVSVTMLQALSMGKAVLSTPTIGATEWSKFAPAIALSNGFSVRDLHDLLVNHNGGLNFNQCEDAKRAVVKHANLKKNVQARLRVCHNKSA
jgi:glycosyltransferase involved in cell wall biosynthesis